MEGNNVGERKHKGKRVSSVPYANALSLAAILSVGRLNKEASL